MKINALILALTIIMGFLWIAYSHRSLPNPPPLPVNESSEFQDAPDFTYTTLEGHTLRLSKHTGNVILLHFWATWCTPCLVEFPELVRLAQQEQKNLVVLAISSDLKKDQIEKFLHRLDIKIPDNFIIIHDVDNSITQSLYQTFKLPETYLIGPDQKIIEKLIGPQEDWNSEKWQKKIQNLASQAP